MPVSSSTVAVQMAFEPDIAGYSVGSMMMNPARSRGRREGTTRLACTATLPRGSRSSRLAQAVAVASQRLHAIEYGVTCGRQHTAGDDVADLASSMTANHSDRVLCSHRCQRGYRR